MAYDLTPADTENFKTWAGSLKPEQRVAALSNMKGLQDNLSRAPDNIAPGAANMSFLYFSSDTSGIPINPEIHEVFNKIKAEYSLESAKPLAERNFRPLADNLSALYNTVETAPVITPPDPTIAAVPTVAPASPAESIAPAVTPTVAPVEPLASPAPVSPPTVAPAAPLTSPAPVATPTTAPAAPTSTVAPVATPPVTPASPVGTPAPLATPNPVVSPPPAPVSATPAAPTAAPVPPGTVAVTPAGPAVSPAPVVAATPAPSSAPDRGAPGEDAETPATDKSPAASTAPETADFTADDVAKKDSIAGKLTDHDRFPKEERKGLRNRNDADALLDEAQLLNDKAEALGIDHVISDEKIQELQKVNLSNQDPKRKKASYVSKADSEARIKELDEAVKAGKIDKEKLKKLADGLNGTKFQETSDEAPSHGSANHKHHGQQHHHHKHKAQGHEGH